MPVGCEAGGHCLFAGSRRIRGSMHDLLFRNACLVDGTGAPARMGHLAVSAGRIAAVGPDAAAPARQVIDAEGLVLAPGIIDTHTHYDAQVTWDPALASSTALGVTTAIIGNCGFTIAPCRAEDRDLVMRNLTQVEGMSLETLRSGIRWDFETFPDYLEMLAAAPLGPNVAAFIGHSSVRTYVMREDAPRRAASDAEIARMRELVRQGLAAGAVGFSTTTSPSHNGDGGIPMPSRMAADAELLALTDTLRDHGRGVFMLTKGGGTRIAFLEEIAARNGRPVVIAALLHNSTAPQAVFDDLDGIAAANARGRRLLGAVSCCPLTFEFTLRSPYPLESLAAWKPAFEARGAAVRGVLTDPAFRASIRDELSRPAPVRLFNGEWRKLHVTEVADPRHAGHEGHSIGELAAAAGVDPLDFMLDLALAEDLGTVFTSTLLNSDENAVGRMLNHPNSLVTLSDAGAHLTFFNDAGFGLHLLGHWVREVGAMSLEQAVHRLCGQGADVFGITDRGRLAAGFAADLMLFDAATVGRGAQTRVFDLPAGAARLETPAQGLQGVWVNGVQLTDANGPVRGAAPGRLLREFAA
jgi:N-acyl-D-aspartate/D-glutamate deacylase